MHRFVMAEETTIADGNPWTMRTSAEIDAVRGEERLCEGNFLMLGREVGGQMVLLGEFLQADKTTDGGRKGFSRRGGPRVGRAGGCQASTRMICRGHCGGAKLRTEGVAVKVCFKSCAGKEEGMAGSARVKVVEIRRGQDDVGRLGRVGGVSMVKEVGGAERGTTQEARYAGWL